MDFEKKKIVKDILKRYQMRYEFNKIVKKFQCQHVNLLLRCGPKSYGAKYFPFEYIDVALFFTRYPTIFFLVQASIFLLFLPGKLY